MVYCCANRIVGWPQADRTENLELFKAAAAELEETFLFTSNEAVAEHWCGAPVNFCKRFPQLSQAALPSLPHAFGFMRRLTGLARGGYTVGRRCAMR